MAAQNLLLDFVTRSRLARVIGASAAAGAITLASTSEGTVKATYWDPVPILTACTGHTDATLKLGQKFTDEQCKEFLDGDLTKAAQGMQDCVHVMLNEGELVAYTDFAFNEGIAAFCDSTMARELNEGDHDAACAELPRWDMATIHGVKTRLKGLTLRRQKEYDFCMRGSL